MSVQIRIDLPESSFSMLRINPEDFAREMLLAATVKWYEMGKVSQSKAIELLGISRQEFLRCLSRYQVSPFQSTLDELTEEINRE